MNIDGIRCNIFRMLLEYNELINAGILQEVKIDSRQTETR